MALGPDQRSRLLHAKLRGLVAASEVFAGTADSTQPASFPAGAALVTSDSAWILLDEHPTQMLGAALAWADQRGVADVHLLADVGAGELARRAQCFARPIAVWQVDGSSCMRAEPAPVPTVARPPEDALELVGVFRDAGLDIVVEHGHVRGEILGLEVARIVADDGPAHIEVGVGRNDRDAFEMVHGDVPTEAALGRVVQQVREQRRPGDLTHPLARLAPERWLRAEVLRNPARVGAASLDPVEPTVFRDSVRDSMPAIAVGSAIDGTPLVVACSVGVDLDLVPAAADARLSYAPGARLLLVVPERDAHPVTRRLADALAAPAEFVTVPDDFRR